MGHRGSQGKIKPIKIFTVYASKGTAPKQISNIKHTKYHHTKNLMQLIERRLDEITPPPQRAPKRKTRRISSNDEKQVPIKRQKSRPVSSYKQNESENREKSGTTKIYKPTSFPANEANKYIVRACRDLIYIYRTRGGSLTRWSTYKSSDP